MHQCNRIKTDLEASERVALGLVVAPSSSCSHRRLGLGGRAAPTRALTILRLRIESSLARWKPISNESALTSSSAASYSSRRIWPFSLRRLAMATSVGRVLPILSSWEVLIVFGQLMMS